MSFLNTMKEAFNTARKGLATEVQKFKSKDLMEAIVAGSAMIAYADGEISSAEKQKLMGFIRTSDELSVFDSEKVIEAFNRYAGKFEFDAMIGKGEVLKKVALFKDKPEAQLIVRVCMAIANSDGHFDETERKAVAEVCSTLDLRVEDFI